MPIPPPSSSSHSSHRPRRPSTHPEAPLRREILPVSESAPSVGGRVFPPTILPGFKPSVQSKTKTPTSTAGEQVSKISPKTQPKVLPPPPAMSSFMAGPNLLLRSPFSSSSLFPPLPAAFSSSQQTSTTFSLQSKAEGAGAEREAAKVKDDSNDPCETFESDVVRSAPFFAVCSSFLNYLQEVSSEDSAALEMHLTESDRELFRGLLSLVR